MSKAELTDKQCLALEKVEHEFTAWRESKTGRQRIPESLWSSAADLFHSFGLTVNRIARSLRLNYSSLKAYITENSPVAIASTADAPATFIELEPAQVCLDCVIEMEDQSGIKMRMCFRGGVDPAVIDLGKYFLGGRL